MKLEAAGTLPARSYVLLVSGTMNPPHKGHISIGLHAARSLRRAGHTVTAVCYVPVHDNYLHNKVSLTAATTGGARKPGGPLGTSQDTLCFSLSTRCEMLRILIQAEDPEDATLCHVLDYELAHGSELLADSPGYWAPRLPEGYLRTVPTTELIRHFASHSPLLAAPGARLGVVFGIDTLGGMASWNSPERLLSQADLVVVCRAVARVDFGKDPAAFLGAVRHVRVEAAVPIAHGGRTLFGEELGGFVNRAATGEAALMLLPPLAGSGENLSSTAVRTSVASCLQVLSAHGFPLALAAKIVGGAASGADTMKQIAAASVARGEMVNARGEPVRLAADAGSEEDQEGNHRSAKVRKLSGKL